MAIEFEVSAVFPAPAKKIYDAWLNSEGHARMTGSPAKVSDKIGANSRHGMGTFAEKT